MSPYEVNHQVNSSCMCLAEVCYVIMIYFNILYFSVLSFHYCLEYLIIVLDSGLWVGWCLKDGSMLLLVLGVYFCLLLLLQL